MMLRSLFGLVITAVVACAQDAAPSTNPFRLHVIGASVSGGFCDGPLTGATELGDAVTMQQVLKAWCGEHAKATTHNPTQMAQMFLDVEGIGKRQVDAAKKAKVDAVVAVDFAFWFAYGPVRGDEATVRKARLARGLELLAQLEVPVLLGDLPDMRGALRRVMNPAWVPALELQQQLNEQLAAFVAEHKNIQLVALSDLVKTMKHTGAPLPLVEGVVLSAPGALLQGDQLHANRLGMAFLGYTLQDSLRSLFPATHALHAQAWTFEQFVAGCGAESDLEEVRAAAKKAPAAGVGK